jgi:hypothetical protein
MSLVRGIAAALAFAALVVPPRVSLAETSPAPSRAAAHDGGHDFDFDVGTWKTHSSRLMHPLTGANDWVDMDGITVVSKIWGGRANLAEYRAEGPAGVVQLLALRIYNRLPISGVSTSPPRTSARWGRFRGWASSATDAWTSMTRRRSMRGRCWCASPSGA